MYLCVCIFFLGGGVKLNQGLSLADASTITSRQKAAGRRRVDLGKLGQADNEKVFQLEFLFCSRLKGKDNRQCWLFIPKG